MKTAITAIAAILLVASTTSYAYAEVPTWVKNNAGWWADGTIAETEFLSGIEFLIKDGIIAVPPIDSSNVDPTGLWTHQGKKSLSGPTSPDPNSHSTAPPALFAL